MISSMISMLCWSIFVLEVSLDTALYLFTTALINLILAIPHIKA